MWLNKRTNPTFGKKTQDLFFIWIDLLAFIAHNTKFYLTKTETPFPNPKQVENHSNKLIMTQWNKIFIRKKFKSFLLFAADLLQSARDFF